MDKREFIFPGAILGLVLVIAIGLLLTQGRQTTPPIGSGLASTTIATTTDSSETPTQASVAPAHYYPYGPVTLSVNEAAMFKNGVSLRPMAVLQDSRCPKDVQCIQAGTVEVMLKTTANGMSKTQSISLGSTVTAGGLSITFTGAAPEKTKDSKPATSAYRLTFTVTPTSTASAPCYVGGCSSEICSDTKNAVSNCLYNAKYACYKTATCERQSSGACGWTQTAALQACLANPPQE